MRIHTQRPAPRPQTRANVAEAPEAPAIPEGGMNRVASRQNFLVNDLDYAPFGCSWLRGITPARLGVVELLCLIFSARQSGDKFLVFPWHEVAATFILFVHRNFAASVPMLLLVTFAERRTIHASNIHRIAALSSAVVVGALSYAIVLAIFYGVSPYEYEGATPFF